MLTKVNDYFYDPLYWLEHLLYWGTLCKYYGDENFSLIELEIPADPIKLLLTPLFKIP